MNKVLGFAVPLWRDVSVARDPLIVLERLFAVTFDEVSPVLWGLP